MTTAPLIIAPETKVRISEGVYARAFGEEMVLLDFARGEYFGLDPIGAVIWQALEGGAPLRDIAERVVAGHDVAFDVALGDVIDLVGELRHHGLIAIES